MLSRELGLRLALDTIHRILLRHGGKRLRRPKLIRKGRKRYSRPVRGDRVQLDFCKIARGISQDTTIGDCTRWQDADPLLPAQFAESQRFYNTERPHTALGDHTPGEHLQQRAHLVPNLADIHAAYAANRERDRAHVFRCDIGPPSAQWPVQTLHFAQPLPKSSPESPKDHVAPAKCSASKLLE